ncbi:hypothetical protein [Halorhabdus salina]|uniref:hypothetical protein n=1 Tax=Halorhabdus salina TaxID=2750670 RepID=UPI0015EE80AB|nr:hypothetical protein [Halorhabdus salina]
MARETRPKRYAFPLSRLERRRIEAVGGSQSSDRDERGEPAMSGDTADEYRIAFE